jgi:hypothetical protein
MLESREVFGKPDVFQQISPGFLAEHERKNFLKSENM